MRVGPEPHEPQQPHPGAQPPAAQPGPPGKPGPEQPPAGPAHEVLGVAVEDDKWFVRLDPHVTLSTGTPTTKPLRVPAADAQRLLRDAAREAAGIPKGGPPSVVFTALAGELLIRTGGLTLACGSGLVTIGVPVSCDQLPQDAPVTVPFAVGTEAKPAGLLMTTVDRPDGPAVVVDGWGSTVTAFAWQALLQLAVSLCAAAGKDWAGDPLVPGYLGAADGFLVVAPMARHRAPIPIPLPPIKGAIAGRPQ